MSSQIFPPQIASAPPSQEELIQKRLDDLKYMSDRFGEKYGRYKAWTYTLRWVIGLCGVVTALRDSSPIKDLKDWPLLFPVIGATTALVTIATGQFKWAERMGVALNLKLRCDSGSDQIRADWTTSPNEQKGTLDKVTALVKEVREIAANNQINYRGRDGSSQ